MNESDLPAFKVLIDNPSPEDVRRDTDVGLGRYTIVTARLKDPSPGTKRDHWMVASMTSGLRCRQIEFGTKEQMLTLHAKILAEGGAGILTHSMRTFKNDHIEEIVGDYEDDMGQDDPEWDIDGDHRTELSDALRGLPEYGSRFTVHQFRVAADEEAERHVQ